MASCRKGESKVWLPYPALEEEIAIRQTAWGSWRRNDKGKFAGPKSKPGYQRFSFRWPSYLLAARLRSISRLTCQGHVRIWDRPAEGAGAGGEK
jgi:hypothetical protein